jgi:Meckel syndrome type 1 protein
MLSRRSQDASAPAGQADASAQASGALQDASPRAAKSARLQAAASAFSALERWTSFSAGAGVRRARGDVEGLPALVGTVARSANVPDASLDAPVQARLSLYRGDTLVAVLEIAGDQVRWTPQPGGTALVGTPPAQALDALRSLLAR